MFFNLLHSTVTVSTVQTDCRTWKMVSDGLNRCTLIISKIFQKLQFMLYLSLFWTISHHCLTSHEERYDEIKCNRHICKQLLYITARKPSNSRYSPLFIFTTYSFIQEKYSTLFLQTQCYH